MNRYEVISPDPKKCSIIIEAESIQVKDGNIQLTTNHGINIVACFPITWAVINNDFILSENKERRLSELASKLKL